MLNRFNHEPTTNREDEAAIIEAAFREGYIQPRTDIKRNGKKVAVIGAGPAGLVAANDLNLMGYNVTVFEKNEAVGGLLRYGIPNFKLNKAIIDRRIALLEQEGIEFKYGAAVEYAAVSQQLAQQYDAVVLATGTPTARDLKIPGRELKGVHFALELLSQQNRVLAGQVFSDDERITAKNKNVLVIGGGDTGSDCIGTAHRQGCKSVTQIEQEIDWQKNPQGGRPIMVEKGQPEIIKAELVLLAMGFLKPEHPQLPENVFVCGDAANGASLVVRAMASGRETAQKVNTYLK